MEVDVGKVSLDMNVDTTQSLPMEVTPGEEVELSISFPKVVPMTMEQTKTVNMGLSTKVVVNHISGDTYDGDYTITPTQNAQTLQTIYKTCTDNIKINPIPSNYGLITWNGSTLTVS